MRGWCTSGIPTGIWAPGAQIHRNCSVVALIAKSLSRLLAIVLTTPQLLSGPRRLKAPSQISWTEICNRLPGHRRPGRLQASGAGPVGPVPYQSATSSPPSHPVGSQPRSSPASQFQGTVWLSWAAAGLGSHGMGGRALSARPSSHPSSVLGPVRPPASGLRPSASGSEIRDPASGIPTEFLLEFLRNSLRNSSFWDPGSRGSGISDPGISGSRDPVDPLKRRQRNSQNVNY